MNISEIKTNTFWKGEAEVKGLVEDQGKLYQTRIYVKGSQLIQGPVSMQKRCLTDTKKDRPGMERRSIQIRRCDP